MKKLLVLFAFINLAAVSARAERAMELYESEFIPSKIDAEKARSFIGGLKDLDKFNFTVDRMVGLDLQFFPDGIILQYTVLADKTDIGLNTAVLFQNLRNNFFLSSLTTKSYVIKVKYFQHILYDDITAIRINRTETYLRSWNSAMKKYDTEKIGGQDQGLMTIQLEDGKDIQFTAKSAFMNNVCNAFECLAKRSLYKRSSRPLEFSEKLMVTKVLKSTLPNVSVFSVIKKVDGKDVASADSLEALLYGSGSGASHKLLLVDTNGASVEAVVALEK